MDEISKISVRPAEERDDAIVGELLVRAFVDAYAAKRPEFIVSPERQKELRSIGEHRRNGLVLVGELDGRIIGTVTLFKSNSPSCHSWHPGCSELRFLATDSAIQGKGYGDPLMDEAKRACQNWGASGISIRVRRGLDRLAAYYRKHGFGRDPQGDLEATPGVHLEGYTLWFVKADPRVI